jgi:hypothetical protein
LLISRAHGADKNSKRIRAIESFFSTYGHFAEFPAYGRLLWKKNQKKKFRPENFPNYRYDSVYYILKVSAQTDEFFSRYRINKKWTLSRAFVRK